MKIKVRRDGQFLVGGIGETAEGSLRLFVGEKVEGELVYRGTVELGVGRALVRELLKRRPAPGIAVRAPSLAPKVTWLEPTVAVEVSYGRLQQGWLREPVCRGVAVPRAAICRRLASATIRNSSEDLFNGDNHSRPTSSC